MHGACDLAHTSAACHCGFARGYTRGVRNHFEIASRDPLRVDVSQLINKYRAIVEWDVSEVDEG